MGETAARQTRLRTRRMVVTSKGHSKEEPRSTDVLANSRIYKILQRTCQEGPPEATDSRRPWHTTSTEARFTASLAPRNGIEAQYPFGGYGPANDNAINVHSLRSSGWPPPVRPSAPVERDRTTLRRSTPGTVL